MAHFRQAHQSHMLVDDHAVFFGCQEPADQAGLLRPRLGYHGPLDKRVDFELLDFVARTRREWQLVLIGPVVGLKPTSLPRHDNLHYLGPRPYAQLPGYISGWDVALMPFAINEATRCLNPTNVLEYMAAERMSVSTRITDVAEPYCGIVYSGHSPNTFILACERALRATPDEHADRIRAMREVLLHTSWQMTVSDMERVMLRTLEQRRGASLFTMPALMLSNAQNEWAPAA